MISVDGSQERKVVDRWSSRFPLSWRRSYSARTGATVLEPMLSRIIGYRHGRDFPAWLDIM